MKPLIVAVSMTILAIVPLKAAVLVETGTTIDGRAYLTIPSIEFVINTPAPTTGFSIVGFEIGGVWSTQGMTPMITADASGLSYIYSGAPSTSVPVEGWTWHTVPGSAYFSPYDSLLLAYADPSAIYTPLQKITLQGGTLYSDSSVPSSLIFPTGHYEIVFIGAGMSGQILSAPGSVVPEPSTFVLTALAGGGILLRNRRRGKVLATTALTLLLASFHANADEPLKPEVEVLGFIVSTLPQDWAGVAVSPLRPDKPEPLYYDVSRIGSGTQVTLLINMPLGTRTTAKEQPNGSSNVRVTGLRDSTGKDLLTPAEGAIPVGSTFGRSNRLVRVVPSPDRTRAIVVINGLRAPYTGATEISGGVEIPVEIGNPKPYESPKVLLEGKGNISDGGRVLFSYEPSEFIKPPSRENPATVKLKGVKLFGFAPEILEVEVIEDIRDSSKKSSMTFIPAEESTLSLEKPKGFVTFRITTSTGTAQMVPVTFSTGLGISAAQ